MKNRFTDRVKNHIDLTSLLDVIFIVLMIVICNQQINLEEKSTEVEAMYAEAVQMQDEASVALTDAKLYKEQLDTYEHLFENMTSISVRVDYVPSDIKNRKIKVLINNEENQFDLNPENTDSAYGKLEQIIVDKLDASQDIPAIISVEDEQILYRDLNRVNAIIDGLDYDNVYRKSGSGSLGADNADE